MAAPVAGEFQSALETPLQRAAGHGHADAAAALLSTGTDVTASAATGALREAVTCGDAKAIETLVSQGVSASASDDGGLLPLHHAAQLGHLEALNTLLQHGADANARSTGPMATTPLLLAAGSGHVSAVGALIDGGANPCGVDDGGCSPLHIAAREGHKRVAALLVARSAPLDAQDAQGRTPIALAVEHGNNSAARLLFKNGAILPPEAFDPPSLCAAESKQGAKRQELRLLYPANDEEEEESRLKLTQACEPSVCDSPSHVFAASSSAAPFACCSAEQQAAAIPSSCSSPASASPTPAAATLQPAASDSPTCNSPALPSKTASTPTASTASLMACESPAAGSVSPAGPAQPEEEAEDEYSSDEYSEDFQEDDDDDTDTASDAGVGSGASEKEGESCASEEQRHIKEQCHADTVAEEKFVSVANMAAQEELPGDIEEEAIVKDSVQESDAMAGASAVVVGIEPISDLVERTTPVIAVGASVATSPASSTKSGCVTCASLHAAGAATAPKIMPDGSAGGADAVHVDSVSSDAAAAAATAPCEMQSHPEASDDEPLCESLASSTRASPPQQPCPTGLSGGQPAIHEANCECPACLACLGTPLSPCSPVQPAGRQRLRASQANSESPSSSACLRSALEPSSPSELACQQPAAASVIHSESTSAWVCLRSALEPESPTLLAGQQALVASEAHCESPTSLLCASPSPEPRSPTESAGQQLPVVPAVHCDSPLASACTSLPLQPCAPIDLAGRQPVARQHDQSVKEAFLTLMRSRGDGSVALAWRRHFQVDSDGRLTFNNFCKALCDLDYREDAVEVWHAFSPDGASTLGLELLDPRGAGLIAEFSRWCQSSCGGPLGILPSADINFPDSLSHRKLLARLRELGLFDEVHMSEALDSEESFSQHMYPLLDPWSKGIVHVESFSFLEHGPSTKPPRKPKRSSKAAACIDEAAPPKAPISALNMLSNLKKQSKFGLDIDKYLQPVPEEFISFTRQAQERRKPKIRLRVPLDRPRRSASTPELPPASQEAASTAAAVMMANSQELPRSLSLPRLPRAGPHAAGRSVAGSRLASSRCGGDAMGSESSYQCSVAASSVVATRKGMRRLYKSNMADKLPALKGGAALQDRDIRAALSGANCHRRQVDTSMNPQRCEDLLSQNYERALFQQYCS